MSRRLVLGLASATLVAGIVLAACQPPPAGTAAPAGTPGEGTPIAPAAEPNTFRPDATTPLPLPSEAPVAPAAEPNTFRPDPTVPWPTP